MLEDILINKEITIKEAIKKLDATAKKILIVVEYNDVLLGTVTDGDIRRWILKNESLNYSVENIMNSNPIFLYEEKAKLAKSIMEEKQIDAIPIVDKYMKIKNVIFLNSIGTNVVKNNGKKTTPIVIMAGGKGTRLYPYTKILPKPLIPIGEFTITERILNNFIKFGYENFYLSINCKKNMIKAYFNELEPQYNIKYIEEENYLGTCGSLFLLKDIINETFFVSNCDILVDSDYTDIMKYHKDNNNIITIVTSLKNYSVPYGVIRLNNNGEVIEVEEKPELNYLVNTGFYVLEKEALNDIPKNEFFNITDLIDQYIREGKKIGTYPVRETSWLDMGQMDEMNYMIERLE